MAQSLSPMFVVRRNEPQLITPAKPTPHEIKKLSDIDDQEGFHFEIKLVTFYRSQPSVIGLDPVAVIREAITKALVFYYPFAGRLVQGPNKKLMVDCNGKGIVFIEADANIELGQLGDFIKPPCPYVDEFLYDVPGSAGILGCPLLLVQVTRLKCEGFILAIRLNHAVSDGHGLAQFLSTVGEIARSSKGGYDCEPSIIPVWDREILNARNPPRVTCKHPEYEVVEQDIKCQQMTMEINNMVHSSVSFGSGELTLLRNQLPAQLGKCSSFDLVTASVWKARTISLELDDSDTVARLTLAVSCNQHVKLRPGYYGNAFTLLSAVSKAGLLSNKPLEYALQLVRKAKTQMNKKYMRSLADYLVLNGRPHFVKTWNYVVSDTRHAGFEKLDFVWGRPVYGGPTGAFPGCSFYSHYRNSNGEDSIVVPIWLPENAMNRFRQELLEMMTMTSDNRNDELFDDSRRPPFAFKL